MESKIAPFTLFVNLIDNYQKYLSNLLTDKEFNVELYNLAQENAIYLFEIQEKNENIINNISKLKQLLKIKLQSLMTNLTKKEYLKQLDIIERIKTNADTKKLRTDFYIKIKNDLNRGVLKNILYYNGTILIPETILQNIGFQIEQQKKKVDELLDKNASEIKKIDEDIY